jgi:hypothetical protein
MALLSAMQVCKMLVPNTATAEKIRIASLAKGIDGRRQSLQTSKEF